MLGVRSYAWGDVWHKSAVPAPPGHGVSSLEWGYASNVTVIDHHTKKQSPVGKR